MAVNCAIAPLTDTSDLPQEQIDLRDYKAEQIAYRDDLPAAIMEDIDEMTAVLDDKMIHVMTNAIISFQNFYCAQGYHRERDYADMVLQLELPIPDKAASYAHLERYLHNVYATAESFYGEATGGHQLHPDDAVFSLSKAKMHQGLGAQDYEYSREAAKRRRLAKSARANQVVAMAKASPKQAIDFYEAAVDQQQILINMAGEAYNGAVAVERYNAQKKRSSGIFGAIGTVAGAILSNGNPGGAALGGSLGSLFD